MDRLAKIYNKTPLQISLLRNTMKDECNYQGERQALEKLYKQFHYDWYINNPSGLEEVVCENKREAFKDWIGNRNNKSRYKYVMITVAPFTDVHYEEFKKMIDKSLRKKFIVNSLSCLEWTGYEVYDGSKFINGGMHLHTRLEIDNKDPYRIKSEFYSTFKHLCQPQCVSIKYSNREDAFVDYIKGVKKGKEKDCTQITKHHRKLYNIPDMF